MYIYLICGHFLTVAELIEKSHFKALSGKKYSEGLS